MVQWLGLYAFTAEGLGSIPGWSDKPCGVASKQTNKQNKRTKNISLFNSHNNSISNIIIPILQMKKQT